MCTYHGEPEEGVSRPHGHIVLGAELDEAGGEGLGRREGLLLHLALAAPLGVLLKTRDLRP